MKLAGIGPSGELGYEVELAKQLAHHLAGVVALAELFELAHDAREGLFRLRNGTIRIVLTLAFETLMMFEELLTEEIG